MKKYKIEITHEKDFYEGILAEQARILKLIDEEILNPYQSIIDFSEKLKQKIKEK